MDILYFSGHFIFYRIKALYNIEVVSVIFNMTVCFLSINTIFAEKRPGKFEFALSGAPMEFSRPDTVLSRLSNERQSIDCGFAAHGA